MKVGVIFLLKDFSLMMVFNHEAYNYDFHWYIGTSTESCQKYVSDEDLFMSSFSGSLYVVILRARARYFLTHRNLITYIQLLR